MDIFSGFPTDLVSCILSRTSPESVCAVSQLSKALNAAGNSDSVWDAFLPSDCPLILERSVSPVRYDDKKNLYFKLSNDFPVVIDSGKLCFSVDKYGHKVFMVSARALTISWGDNSQHWQWTTWPSSKFPEVLKLVSVGWLDIRGKINTQMLSTNTNYGVFLVYRLDESAYGLETARAVVRLVNKEDDNDAENRADLVHVQFPDYFGGRRTRGRTPTERYIPGVCYDDIEEEDVWMELELGTFYNGEGGDGELEGRLMEIKNLGPKSGLLVEGIEFRPIPI